jgi:hypothetical protein
MQTVAKEALKEILHLMVDKEELPVLQELALALPVKYQAIAIGIITACAPAVIATEDAAIDAI